MNQGFSTTSMFGTFFLTILLLALGGWALYAVPQAPTNYPVVATLPTAGQLEAAKPKPVPAVPEVHPRGVPVPATAPLTARALPELEQKAIYKKLAAIQTQAIRTAEKQFKEGSVDYIRLTDTETARLQTLLSSELKIPISQLEDVQSEGLINGWESE
jgi:hypothetical protein